MARGAYRIIRLGWARTDVMETVLNGSLSPTESVVSISTTNDEIIVLVKEADTP